jgi:lipopolysaccharide transport system ATP-binding protein
MSDVAIRVEGLGKKYRLGAHAQPYNTLRASLADVAAAPLRVASRLTRRPSTEGEGGRHPEFWALKDVSFEVRQREVLGIIGRNGAGKSTLLKLLSQITAPTKGCIKMKGRVASLLEVGTGFHPDLTGRENVFLNGAILGMAHADITRKFDEIVAFAEVETFIDTPVKHYSSGMYLRLAFAVAAHLEPDILVVDEVLAVGDAAFQKKSLGKMGSVAHAGRTVLFVSHNMPAISSLCHRAILLQAGRQAMSGSATSVVASYLAAGAEAPSERVWRDVQSAPGNAKARVHAVRVRDASGDLAMQIDIDSQMTIEVEYWTLVPNTVLNVTLSLFTADGTYVLSSPSMTDTAWYQRPHLTGLFRSRCTIPAQLLNQGRYTVTVLLVENGCTIIAQLDEVVSIDLTDPGAHRGGYFGHWHGVIRPTLTWTTKHLHTSMPGPSNE